MKNQFWIASILFFLSVSGLAQPGCQDPLANNFNPNATSSNGSCSYTTTNIQLATRVTSLPAELAETSSLLITDGRMFTNNDGGNAPLLYQLDTTTGQILKTTAISGFNNIDWEDLAADSTHIYIGDFGNNDGERTNLRILKVKKSSVYHPDSLSVEAKSIKFSYPDQTSFAPSTTHNFDCEAFFFHNGLLHLFTKNLGNKKTKYYTLTTNPGTQVAVLRDSLNTNGLITSASIRNDGKAVVLLGYNKTGTPNVFTWLFFGFENSDYFGGNKRRLELPGILATGQAEGIGFVDQYRLWISNETYSIVTAKIKQQDIKPFVGPFFTGNSELQTQENGEQIYPNPAISSFEFQCTKSGNLEILGLAGNQIANMILEPGRHQISTSGLPPGLVFLRFIENGKTLPKSYKLLILN